jgi:simple sugar transport system permease protein
MSKRLPASAWAAIVLVAVLLLNLVLSPSFFHLEIRDGRIYGSLVDILNRGVPVMLLALGMTLVIATGGVDLSVGPVMAIAGAIAACLIARPDGCFLNALNLHGSIPLIVLVSLVVALACGIFNGLLVSRLEMQPIVATLLLMVAGRGIAQLIANGQIVTFHAPEFEHLGTGAILGLPEPVWIFAASLAIVGLLIRKTALGLFIEATGSNPVAARYAGIDARNVKLVVYAVCGVCAGMAGLIGTADIQAADANNAGLYLELDAILAVAVGGTALTGGRFSLAGSIIGALLMQTLTTTILTHGISAEVTLVVKAAIVVIVCLLQAPAFRERTGKLFARKATA